MSAFLLCTECGVTQATKPTPSGRPRIVGAWKRFGERVLCPDCKARLYQLRAIEFPVVAPLTCDGEETTWEAFREALKVAWGQSTSLANWALRELIAVDFRRLPSMAKCPPMPDLRQAWGPSGLYSHAVACYPEWSLWDRSASSAGSLLRSVEKRYRGGTRTSPRYRILWLGDNNLATHRYPYPYPVHAAIWSVAWHPERPQQPVDEEGVWGWPVVKLPLAGAKWELRLATGRGFLRQLRGFAALVTGEAEGCELAIYRKVDHLGGDSRRPGRSDGPPARKPGNGGSFQTTVMCKIVAYLPASPPGQRERLMVVRTGPDALLTAAVEGRDDPFRLVCAHVRRWVMEHQRRRQQLADDTKHEKRLPAWKKRQLLDRLSEFCRKQNDRLDSAVKEAAAQLIAFAQRQHVATISYDDADQTFVSPFPFAALRDRVELLAQQAGIAWEYHADASGEVMHETPGTARGDVNS